MFMIHKAFAVVALVAVVGGVQPSAPAPVPAPLRELPWGQLNFLHTTDTHGWHGGHLQEASYSADWGDYISFAHHLRQKADAEGVDILLIDTGDRIEGNGLYDASTPRGKYTFDIIKHQEIDVICSGNHELYRANSSYDEFYTTVPEFKGNYLASNLDIHDNKSGNYIPLAPRFRKFKTKNQGIRVVAFGFLFDFHGNANNTVVQLVEDTVKEQWFQDAIRDREVDLFLVTGHVAIRSKEFDTIFKAIRDVQWDTPIQFFGGHTHIRDYKKYDSSSSALESGRYMETIGVMSIDGLNTGAKDAQLPRATPTFNRRYMDNNLFSMYHHTALNDSTFPTKLGTEVSKQIAHARASLKLDEVHGCAPRNLWLARADPKSKHSIFSWLNEQVLPDQFAGSKHLTGPKMILTNTGAMRFDIFKGPFTRDTTYLVSPFTSGFKFIRNVPYSVAAGLLDVLNHDDPFTAQGNLKLDPSELLAPEQIAIRADRLALATEVEHSQTEQVSIQSKPSLRPGYTTKDDDGKDGDDTLHSAISYYAVPPVMQTLTDFPTDGETIVETVDVYFNQFIEPWLMDALEFLGANYSRKDTADYRDGLMLTTMIADWVEEHWPCDSLDEL